LCRRIRPLEDAGSSIGGQFSRRLFRRRYSRYRPL
jgi:hypothetical protein